MARSVATRTSGGSHRWERTAPTVRWVNNLRYWDRPAVANAVANVLPNADVVDLAAYEAKGKAAGQAPNSDGAPGEIRTRAPASGGRCSIP
jgi:hypothetical protein